MEQSRARDVQRSPRAPFWCEKRSSQHDPGMLNFSARSQPPPSTENPGHTARMGHRGRPRAARVGARRGSVPRRCAPCTVPGRGAGGRRRNPVGMTARCPAASGAPSVDVIDPVRVQATAARPSRLPPRSGPECGHDAGRPSRAGAGDARIDPPGCGSGCGSRSGYGRRQAPPLSCGARPPRSRTRA